LNKEKKIKNKVAFFTVIFPKNKEYFRVFFNSLVKQTFKNFDVVVLNDDINNFKEIKDTYSSLSFVELKYSSTPAKNREFGIQYVLENNYDIIIFGDSDDYFEKNRVQVCIDKLKKFNIVINDLTLFDNNCIFIENYISNRVKNNSEIDINFIKNKNIFGMSNTAAKVKILKNIKFKFDMIAVDWYLFSVLLLKGNKAIFTNETKTYYRQHDENTIGIGNISNESILKGIFVKLEHYAMLQKNIIFKDLYKEMLDLKKKTNDKNYIRNLMMQDIRNPLWWENIKLL